MVEEFAVGQLVGLKADPSRQGPIIAVLEPVAGISRYQVFHSLTEQSIYMRDQIMAVAMPAPGGGLGTALREGKWLDPRTFRACLTAARLANPQTDSLYALQAARIKFIPFQMKPLLRFIRADQPRLLIADEVGVGKTIEAGLILKEMETRRRVENVLILCPKALTTKWEAEMRRFDEDFRILDSGSLRYCLDETFKEGGFWPQRYGRSIAHMELFRMDDYLHGTGGRRLRPGLASLDPPPQFDLVIVDEARHIRNPGTNSYELARNLCEMAEAVIFLSATPVQTGSTNLYTLLNLLRPDLFQSEEVFDEVIEPNAYITDAMRHVRSRQPENEWQRAAADSLAQARNTTWGRGIIANDPSFTQWYAPLQAGLVNDDIDRVRCLRDLEELHTLSKVMNRTRRRDIGAFTLRDPVTVEVPFTPEGEVFYEALIDFRRQVLLQDYDPRVVALISDTLERQAASCLPALVPTLDRFLRLGEVDLAGLTDDPDASDEAVHVTIPPRLIEGAARLKALAAALPDRDPKWEQLERVVDDALAADGPGKVLVFSFFLHTLHYLRDCLHHAGYRVELITGAVPDEEREHLRNRFRLSRENPEAIDILLSSEVGCEGLDYEFCDRMVNYDIPWNPMRVEQRIGRIDRFGQRAQKVLIYNFITPGTVEDRIFYRCWERLGIFTQAVGDLEEVLGEIVHDLTRTAMDPTLTPEQAELKATQAADNALRLMEERARLERESKGLLGLDEGYTEDLDEMRRLGKVVVPDDLRQMVAEYLSSSKFDGRLAPDSRTPGLYRLAVRKDARQELYAEIRGRRLATNATQDFTKFLSGAESDLRVTFEQETALEHRDVSFITPVHPLAKLAIEFWQDKPAPIAAGLMVRDGSAPMGRYLFVCDLWKQVGMQGGDRLIPLAFDLERGTVHDTLSSELLRLLSAADGPLDDGALGDLDVGLRVLDEELHRRRLVEVQDLRGRNELMVTRRLASLDAYYKSRRARVEDEVAAATNERIVTMKRSEQSRIAGEYMRKRKEIEGKRSADIVTQRLAVGVLEVRGAE